MINLQLRSINYAKHGMKKAGLSFFRSPTLSMAGMYCITLIKCLINCTTPWEAFAVVCGNGGILSTGLMAASCLNGELPEDFLKA